MEVPSLSDVLRIHERMLELGGGQPGVLNIGAVDSALHRAAWGPFFEPPNLADRAALLLRGLCQDHPFADGNKRTSFETTDWFLSLNGTAMEARETEIVAFILDVAQDRFTVPEIADWIRTHLTRKG